MKVFACITDCAGWEGNVEAVYDLLEKAKRHFDGREVPEGEAFSIREFELNQTRLRCWVLEDGKWVCR